MGKRDKKKTSRQLAVLTLVKWERERLAVHPYIESIIYGSALGAVDRQLAVMIVLGVLRQLQYLDSIINRYTRHPLAKMKPLTLAALRVGVFQVIFLDRVPDSAAVNETVKALKAERQPHWIVNFANGVLRNISRHKKELSRPDCAKNNSPVLNHPEWLVQRWQGRYGAEKAEQICRINNKEPHLVLRVNTRLTSLTNLVELLTEADAEVQPGHFAPDALIIGKFSGPISDLPGYKEGLYHVQDEAAQLVTMLLGPFESNKNYLDGCAGLGGKTCQIGQLIPDDSFLMAVEPNNRRYVLLQENLQRLKLNNKVQIFHGHIGELLEKEQENFHAILVDAPCSGTGVIRRHPDIKWNRDIRDLQLYQNKQLEILQEAAQLLLPSGILVYATCSMEPEENEKVIDAFLARNQNFSRTDACEVLPTQAKELVNGQGFFATTPVSGLDGFFGARLVKQRK